MIKHALLGGITNLIRSFWLSATAITVLTVSLGSVALVASFSTMAGYTIRQLDNQISIVAYFKEELPKDTIDTAITEVKTLPEVKNIEFVNRDQAKQELINSSRTASEFLPVLQNATENFTLEYIVVTPTSSEAYQKTYDFLNDSRFDEVFQDVSGSLDFINRLQNIYYWTNVIGVILVGIFAIVSILVMINILRIAVYNRRTEIEIMRLVGATNAYIRGPFVAEGAYFNIIAAIIILLIFIPTVGILIPQIESYLRVSVSGDTGNLLIQMYISLGVTILLGILVGIFTAYFATKRYLKS